MTTSQRTSSLTLFACIYLIMAAFCYMMPLVADDFFFLSQLKTFPNVFALAANKYMVWDGRFMAYVTNHTLLELPHVVYILLAPAVFCCTLFLLFPLAGGPGWRQHFTPRNILFVAALLWASIPAFGSIYFWKTGSCYSVGILVSLLFLLPFRFPDAAEHHGGLCATLAFGLLGIVVGLYDYSTPLLCALLAWSSLAFWAVYKKKPLKTLGLHAAGVMGLSLGVLITFLAPGNAKRTLSGLSEQKPVYETLGALLTAHLNALVWFIIPLLFIGLALYDIRTSQATRTRPWRGIPPWAIIFSLLALVGHALYVLAPAAVPSRAYTFIGLLWILAVCTLTAAMPPLSGGVRRVWALLVTGLALYCLVSLPMQLNRFHSAQQTVEKRLELLAHGKDQDICLPPLPVGGDRYMIIGGPIEDVQPRSNHWINKALANIWQLNSVTICPPEGTTKRRYASTDGLFELNSHQYIVRLTLPATTTPQGPQAVKVLYPSKSLGRLPESLQVWLVTHLLDERGAGRFVVPLLYRNATVDLNPEGHTLTGEFTMPRMPHEALDFYVQVSPQAKNYIRLRRIP